MQILLHCKPVDIHLAVMFCQTDDTCFRFRGLGLCFEETLWNSTSINSCQAKTCRFYERSPKYQPQPKLHFHHQTLSLSLSVTLSTALKASLALSVCCQSPRGLKPIKKREVLTQEHLKVWSNPLPVSMHSTQLTVTHICCQPSQVCPSLTQNCLLCIRAIKKVFNLMCELLNNPHTFRNQINTFVSKIIQCPLLLSTSMHPWYTCSNTWFSDKINVVHCRKGVVL